MKMNMYRVLATIAVLGLSCASANGQIVLVNYDMAGEPGNQVSTSGTSNSPLISGAIVDRGPGLNVPATGTLNSISSIGWDSLDPTEDYFSLRFTVAPGEAVDMQSLVIGTRSSGTGPGDLGLFYSGDNFTTNLFTFTVIPEPSTYAALVGLAILRRRAKR